uniref:HTH La-type RNA-binding domain-containing protein n=1 Tax=Fagus sylvatica TaxID=28930 RepID=A0A2N9J3G6_FAGSY
MATNSSANSNSASQSPRQSGGGDTIGSPQSRRGGRPVSSPWTQIVRGESEPTTIGGAATPSSSTAAIEPAVTVGLVVEEAISESSENGPNGNGGKRPAWNKPSNGAAAEVGPVMGAVSWPALSESTRPPSKSSPDSFKPLSDGSSVLVSQGTGATSSAAQKQVSNNVNPSSTSNNHSVSTRPRSMKRNNTSTSSNGGLPQQQVPPVPAVEMASNNPLPKDHTHRSGFASHSGNDHPQHRNSFRGRNGGSHPRGDGSHHHNYGNRRDQERGNQDWGHRNFTGRDTHMQTPRGVPRYIRPPPPPPPPSSAPFIQPVRHFGSPIGFPELPPTVLYGMPFVPLPPPAVFFSAPDLQLHTKIVNQIDYYFSNENLIKDTYLRQNMDDQGWVPIKLIARFNKVMHLTENIQLILDAVRTSNVLEVQGDKVRRRGDWMRWIMPASVQFPKTLGNSSLDTVAGQVQSMALEENTTNHNNSRGPADVHAEGFPSGLPSEDLSSQLQLSGGEGTAQVGIQAGSARN